MNTRKNIINITKTENLLAKGIMYLPSGFSALSTDHRLTVGIRRWLLLILGLDAHSKRFLKKQHNYIVSLLTVNAQLYRSFVRRRIRYTTAERSRKFLQKSAAMGYTRPH